MHRKCTIPVVALSCMNMPTFTGPRPRSYLVCLFLVLKMNLSLVLVLLLTMDDHNYSQSTPQPLTEGTHVNNIISLILV